MQNVAIWLSGSQRRMLLAVNHKRGLGFQRQADNSLGYVRRDGLSGSSLRSGWTLWCWTLWLSRWHHWGWRCSSAWQIRGTLPKSRAAMWAVSETLDRYLSWVWDIGGFPTMRSKDMRTCPISPNKDATDCSRRSYIRLQYSQKESCPPTDLDRCNECHRLSARACRNKRVGKCMENNPCVCISWHFVWNAFRLTDGYNGQASMCPAGLAEEITKAKQEISSCKVKWCNGGFASEECIKEHCVRTSQLNDSHMSIFVCFQDGRLLIKEPGRWIFCSEAGGRGREELQ